MLFPTCLFQNQPSIEEALGTSTVTQETHVNFLI